MNDTTQTTTMRRAGKLTMRYAEGRAIMEGGKFGRHEIEARDGDRVEAHWAGYCENNGEHANGRIIADDVDEGMGFDTAAGGLSYEDAMNGGIPVSAYEARCEVERQGADWRDFLAENGQHETYGAREVLVWLGW